MYRNLNVIITLLFLYIAAACVAEKNEYVYENSSFRVILKEQCKKLVCIELINLQSHSTYSAVPVLEIYDDGIPVEGGLVADYNKLINNNIESCNIEDVYSCDSVYEIDTDSIRICFGQESRSLGEVKTLRRLNLDIYESKMPDFVDGNYTLYAVKR